MSAEGKDLDALLLELEEKGDLEEAGWKALEELAHAQPVAAVIPPEILEDPATEQTPAIPPAGEEVNNNIRHVLANLSIPERIKMALYGNSACRAILIMDPSKMIASCVLRNPRLLPKEVEDFARNPQLGVHIIRALSSNSRWARSYQLKVALVSNPKSPPDVSLKWLRYLQVTDLKKIARSKQIPEVVAIGARKRLSDDRQ